MSQIPVHSMKYFQTGANILAISALRVQTRLRLDNLLVRTHRTSETVGHKALHTQQKGRSLRTLKTILSLEPLHIDSSASLNQSDNIARYCKKDKTISLVIRLRLNYTIDDVTYQRVISIIGTGCSRIE